MALSTEYGFFSQKKSNQVSRARPHILKLALT